MYGENTEKSYLFSTGDGIRSTAGAGSWRQAVTKNLGAWWAASQRAAEILIDERTTHNCTRVRCQAPGKPRGRRRGSKSLIP